MTTKIIDHARWTNRCTAKLDDGSICNGLYHVKGSVYAASHERVDDEGRAHQHREVSFQR